jgi:hypothetical protein
VTAVGLLATRRDRAESRTACSHASAPLEPYRKCAGRRRRSRGSRRTARRTWLRPDGERPRSVLGPADRAPAIPLVVGAGVVDDSRPPARRDHHTARHRTGGFNGHADARARAKHARHGQEVTARGHRLRLDGACRQERPSPTSTSNGPRSRTSRHSGSSPNCHEPAPGPVRPAARRLPREDPAN